MVSLLVTLRNTLAGFSPGLFLGYGLVTPGGCLAFRTALAYRENRDFVQTTECLFVMEFWG